MLFLGAHMSIAGGYYKAVEAAAKLNMRAVQLFTKNNNQWRAKPIEPEEAERFRRALAEHKIVHTTSHNSYLINLASPDEELWRKSVEAMVVEIQRADALGLPYVVAHPGAFTSSSEQAGLERIATALDEVHAQTSDLATGSARERPRILLETTAGQGSCLGWKFEHLAAILDRVKDPDRLGVCVDTCHIFAAGYPLATPKDYKATFKAFADTIGLERIRAFHLNDSKKGLGSRVDRHEHIGDGQLGLEPFRMLLNDRRFRKIPMYLETEKGQRDGQDLDAINLATLRSLVSDG